MGETLGEILGKCRRPLIKSAHFKLLAVTQALVVGGTVYDLPRIFSTETTQTYKLNQCSICEVHAVPCKYGCTMVVPDSQCR